LITDITKEPKQLDFENSNKVSKRVLEFNSKYIHHLQNYFKREPDAVLFNLQFVKFEIKSSWLLWAY
jgi:hypothetical protein